MPSSPVTKVVDYLRKTMLRQEVDCLSDGQLLDRYLDKRDDAAFAALVRRHGPMVWGVCRRIVGHADDAEDAFQAAFIVLVRNANAVKPREAVANWLYGVACHTALKARTAGARVRAKEKQVTSMPERAKDLRDDREEMQMLLDQELSALPDKYRLPVVLCDLEGRTRKAVAAQLKIPEGTLSSRLATAHQMLAKRLARHGLAVSGGSLAALFAQNAASASVPATLVCSTIKTATLVTASQGAVAGVVSAKVAALTAGVMKTMLLSKLKIAITVLVVMTALIGVGAGVGALTPQTAAEAKGEKPTADTQKTPPDKPKTDKERLQGTWEFVSFTHGGKTVKKEDLPKGGRQETLKFVGDKTLYGNLSADGKVVESKGSFKIDPSRKPKEIDLIQVREDGENRFGTASGIYEVEGDSLRLCWPGQPTDLERPTKLESKEGDSYHLMTYKRVAKDVPKGADPKDEIPLRGNPILSNDDLRGTWTGEKNGINVDLTFHGKEARWQGHWNVNFTKVRAGEDPERAPAAAARIGTDLKCVADEKAGRLNLFLPAYLGDNKDIKQSSWNGKSAVGQIQRGVEGTLRLRIIPTGYENVAEQSYDFPAVEGLILRRVDNLQGTWRLVATESDGLMFGEGSRVVKDTRLVIDKASFTLFGKLRHSPNVPLEPEDVKYVAAFKLDTKQTPQVMVLAWQESPWPGKKDFTHKAIYMVEGDTLKLCLGMHGDDKNITTEFSANAGSKRSLWIFKRDPASEKGGEKKPRPGLPHDVKATPPSKPAEPPKAELKGTWRMVTAEADGVRNGAGRPEIKDNRLVIANSSFTFFYARNIELDGNTLELRKAESATSAGAFKLDTKQTPQVMVLTWTEHPLNGKKDVTQKAIYALDGDTLRLCLSTADDDMQSPTAFSAPAGSKRCLWTFKREPATENEENQQQPGVKDDIREKLLKLEGPVTSVLWNPDGKLMAVVATRQEKAKDGDKERPFDLFTTVRIHDAKTGKRRCRSGS